MSRVHKAIEMIGRKDVSYIIAVVDNNNYEMAVQSGGTFENKALLQGAITAEILGIEYTDFDRLKKMQRMLKAVKVLMEEGQ